MANVISKLDCPGMANIAPLPKEVEKVDNFLDH